MSNEDPKELHVLAAGLKPINTWFMLKCLQECREACGGMGYLACNRIAKMRNDEDISVTWEGDNRVLLQQVSTSLLKEFQQQFKGDKKFTGMLAFLRRQMNLEIRDKNPVTRSLRMEEHLLDFDFYRNALEYREARLLRELVNQLQENKHKGDFVAWNEAVDVVNALAMAHVERQVLEQFCLHVEKLHKNPLQPILHVLCSLFALSVIEEHMDWYLANLYFSTRKAKAVSSEINKLCGVLRPYAGKLVDGFGIPDGILQAPIAKSDYISQWADGATPANCPH